jgi:proteasome lid subunit RPN8/RPN11
MSTAKKTGAPQLQFSTEVARQIRQHARSNRKTEVCGILIGTEASGITRVEACIAGESAAQGGAHVTFTQDTWEHIYKIKDRDFPDERIVGWYHSHPGFGVFLSDHDTFIHKNFFSSQTQVAWVYDPHSDEEGCFGWRNGRLERVGEFEFVDSRGGERADATGKAEPVTIDSEDEPAPAKEKRTHRKTSESDDELSQLTKIVSNVFSFLAIFVLGGFFVWYLLPRILIMPVPIDPITGRPMKEFLDKQQDAVGYWLNGPHAGQRAQIPLGPLPNAPADAPAAKPQDGAGQENQTVPDAAKKNNDQR